MKLSLCVAAAFAASVSLSVTARADEAPVVRAFFHSSASHDVVQTAACSFDAASTFDGREHAFDVHVGGERCPNRAFDAGAIPLFVWLKHGDTDRVVVEAMVPADVDAQKLQTAIVEITRELRNRVTRASQAPAVAPPRRYAWESAATMGTRHASARARG